jgi:hypothetical protein
MNRLLNNLSRGSIENKNKTKKVKTGKYCRYTFENCQMNYLFTVCYVFIFFKLKTFKITCNIDVVLHRSTLLIIILLRKNLFTFSC